MLGQEKKSKGKTRQSGTIEALLLLTEWNPRSLYFPPPNDGWDSDLLLSTVDKRDELHHGTEAPSRGRWLEDVINPAKRSDRMSWMLAGCGLSLAQELGIFDDRENDSNRNWSMYPPGEERRVEQRHRLRKLLYLYIEQLSSRLGCESIIPQSLSHKLSVVSPSTTSFYRSTDDWLPFMSAWIELTKLVKSVSDMLFHSPSFTKHLLHSGRYINLIEHFQPLLSTWKVNHLHASGKLLFSTFIFPSRTHDTSLEGQQNQLSSNWTALIANYFLVLGPHNYNILHIEYQYARLYTNSLGLQAVVERTLAQSGHNPNPDCAAHITVYSTDYGFIQEVVDGSLEILEKAAELAEAQTLMYSPMRMFLRITTASVFLLKGLSLGVSATKLQTSLDTLNRGIAALRSGTLDDVQLGPRYATLLEIHVTRLQSSFVPSARPPSFLTRPPSMEHSSSPLMDTNGTYPLVNNTSQLISSDPGGMEVGGRDDLEDWLTLPFDPSLVPFMETDTQGLSWLGDGTLDFIWNLEPV
jgi:hypothetical protein